MPSFEPREIRHPWRSLSQIVGLDIHGMRFVFAYAPGEVVVAVDHWLLGEDAKRSRHVGIGRAGALRLLGRKHRRNEQTYRREGNRM